MLGVALLAAQIALSSVPLGEPTDAVRATLTRAREVVASDAARADKLESLRALARALIDGRAMGQRAIGQRLAAQSEPQREAFFELFGEFMVRAYLQRLLFFRNPRFAFGTSRADGDAVLVRTRILTEKDEFHVHYPMQRTGDRWLATDIVVEGISLTDNYGEQFESLLRTRSFDELLDLMRRKLRLLAERDES